MKKFLTLIALLLTMNTFATEQLDFSPAKWIWYPSERILQNTFILLRKEFDLEKQPQSAKGWILADSRYQLYVNGQRVQWGPAPSDPRWPEADPVDIAAYLRPGKNVIACQVLYFGVGEGTWPMGKPGFLFKANIDGMQIVSDSSWKSNLPKSWAQGQYRRSFLRTLQENFDARLFPYGWQEIEYQTDNNWLPAMESDASAAKPAACNTFNEYQWDTGADASAAYIVPRSIPHMIENDVKISHLSESAWVEWKRPADEYFDVTPPDAYVGEYADFATLSGNTWTVPVNGDKAAVLTFEFKDQSVGWPYFTIDAPEGTIVEMLVHEGHRPGGPVIINSHFNSWSRFVCREGVNRFETFDFESLRWLQLHIRNYNRPVKVSDPGMLRRQFPFPQTPDFNLSDPALQRLMGASVNTLYNSAQETVVDGMARERQQYSGDGGHQLHPLYQVFGESRLPARFMKTYSQGISLDGYFLDCWPAFDRLARIMQRQMQLTPWGPLLDHGVGFCFDNFHYYRYTGDKAGLEESFPRLLRFFDYIKKLQKEDGLLPVDSLGVPTVWIDVDAYTQQHHKQCAFNLYTAAMCANALAPLCDAFGETEKAAEVRQFGEKVLAGCVKKYWCTTEKTFVNNLPWATEEGGRSYCDRSLATAIMYDLCPGNDNRRSVEILTNRPAGLGVSYPCNAVWPLWALVKAGRIDVVLNDLRTKWATMASVVENNTLQEHWETNYDTNSQWSHCALAPLIMLYQGIAGVTPLTPGYERTQIRPQLGDLENVSLSVHTPQGPITFSSKGKKGKRDLTIGVPQGITVELLVDERENLRLKSEPCDIKGLKKYILNGGLKTSVTLRY